MKDRLEAMHAVRAVEVGEEDRDVALEIEGYANQGLDTEMEEFFKEIEEIRQLINSIEEDVQAISLKHSVILSNPVNDAKSKEELEELMNTVKKRSKVARTRLLSMESALKADESDVSADGRMRRMQHATASRKFADVMAEYNRIQTLYRERCKNRIQRQLDIAGRNVTSEEMEDMLENGNPQLFTQGIITDTDDAKKQLADIEARHNDIMKLERSIVELHDMFMDVAMLIESQGEMIDRIEYNVETAKDYVDRAVADTKKAMLYQSKARRKIILLIIVISIILGIIIMIICLNLPK